MRITFVLPTIGITGGVRVVFEYANRLLSRGHDVYIVYPTIYPILISRSKIKMIGNLVGNIRNLKWSSNVEWFDLKANLIKVPTIHPKFASMIEKMVPNSDIIIATSWETAYFVNALPKEKGEKFYFVQHYEIWDVWNSLECWKKAREIERDTSKLPIAMSYIIPADPYLKKFKDFVDKTYTLPLKKITISSWLKELLEKRFSQRVYGVIINGVNFDVFHCNRNEENWNSNKKIILMPYRGIPWKGDLDGLKALEEVYEKYNSVIKIWLYGPKKPNNLPRWVKFFEKPNDIELRQLYCNAHIFVVPSWVEGCQLPPMEGMACKCAVVATNVGGIPDYTIPNKTAIVVPPQHPKKLAEGILYLVENWDVTRKVAEEGYKYIRKFTWETAANEFEKILYKWGQ